MKSDNKHHQRILLVDDEKQILEMEAKLKEIKGVVVQKMVFEQ